MLSASRQNVIIPSREVGTYRGAAELMRGVTHKTV